MPVHFPLALLRQLWRQHLFACGWFRKPSTGNSRRSPSESKRRTRPCCRGGREYESGRVDSRSGRVLWQGPGPHGDAASSYAPQMSEQCSRQRKPVTGFGQFRLVSATGRRRMALRWGPTHVCASGGSVAGTTVPTLAARPDGAISHSCALPHRPCVLYGVSCGSRSRGPRAEGHWGLACRRRGVILATP